MKRIVLIADDSTIDRAILKSILQNDYAVQEAAGGEEALSLFERFKADLAAIILDIHMPDIDGFEVIKKITVDPKWRQLPIIVASAEGDVKQQEEALRLGAVGFVSKPYNRPILLHTLANAISLHEMAALANSIKRDDLTGLYNREGFIEAATPLIEMAPPFN